ncbi:MAG: hypothetical protein J7J78_04400 [Thermoprotei archaeon]|nr:hypothetical protein [Thermoprotei archaeon]
MSGKYSSVKLRVEAKRKLEELQLKLRLRGIKASLHEILEKLVEIGLENEDTLVEKLSGKEEAEDPMLEMLDKPMDWKLKDTSVTIDKHLYGE